MRLKSLFARRAGRAQEWTGKSRLSAVSDSAVDGASVCDMSKKASGKRNVAVIGTTGGDVFGCFFSTTVTRKDIAKTERLCLVQVARAVPRPAAVCRDKQKKRGICRRLFEEDGVSMFAIGLDSGPVPVFGLSIRGFVRSAFAKDVKDLRRDTRNDARGRRALFGGCPGHVRLLASHGHCTRVSRCS